MAKIKVPSRKNIKETHPNDPLKFYYWPLLGRIYIRRMEIASGLLGSKKYDKLLDLGFGSGIFLPELASRCTSLFGMDNHGNIAFVKEMAKVEKVEVNLLAGDILKIPFKDKVFDCIVCLSVLEHIKNLSETVKEMYRIVKDDGILVAGFPTKNWIMNLGFTFTGCDYNFHHPSSHTEILKVLKGQFKIQSIKKLPFFLPMDQALYISCVCKKG